MSYGSVEIERSFAAGIRHGATLVSEKRSFEFAGKCSRLEEAGGTAGRGPRGRGDARSPAARRNAALDGRRLKAPRNRYTADAARPPALPACARIARELCLPRRNFIFRTMVKRLIDTLHY